MQQLIQITLSYFTCGIVIRDNLCVEAAPIMKWAIGKSWDTIRHWVESKNGQWNIV